MAKKDFWPLNTTLYVEDFKGNNKLFTYYFLKVLPWEKFNDKSAVPGINRNHVHDEIISIPPLAEQKAIAAVLGSLDNKIDLLHRQNATLERMAETLFRQWFIEEAQEEWEEKPLSSLVDIKSGFPFKSADFTDSGSFYLVTIKSVQDGFLTLDKADKLKKLPNNIKNHCILKRGDIVLSLTGNIGRCCIIDRDNLLLNQRVAILIPKNKEHWGLVYTLFRMKSTKSLLEEMGKGTAQPNLSPIEMSNLTFRIPDDISLTKISNAINPLIKKTLTNKYQIQTLEKLRDTLLPKLMSGEVRVRVDE